MCIETGWGTDIGTHSHLNRSGCRSTPFGWVIDRMVVYSILIYGCYLVSRKKLDTMEKLLCMQHISFILELYSAFNVNRCMFTRKVASGSLEERGTSMCRCFHLIHFFN